MYTAFKIIVINAITQGESVEKKKIQEFCTSLCLLPLLPFCSQEQAKGKKYEETCAPSCAGTGIEWVILPHHPAVSYANSVN